MSNGVLKPAVSHTSHLFPLSCLLYWVTVSKTVHPMLSVLLVPAYPGCPGKEAVV